ncbi:tRNA lysidine(34) synthetase TilS [Aquamicrobium defluvii]|uniref:tRNA(Ile)-lysidine synthase n=1 Tax=Aquamicrobium defluvii TaxID=69279 RepID=A0A4R6YJT6_9HYPH|nr:tRNA lysidine(34) synthetase TilS [Aquamicrobium defluvii]TDR37185.1 tRNA(Ile)-lysidine synthase [Aquamicrobium defluvii]
MLTLEAEPDHDARVFSDIDFSGGAVVAISGGSDSTALLVLLNEFFRAHRPDAKLVAVTVDHALRPAARDEALKVGSLCARLGIRHHIRVWEGPKPLGGVPAAAREARYRLLADVARAEGMGMVLTGHTADDQAETVTMRLDRSAAMGDEGRGLAGMAPATLFDGDIWIVRPLLGMRREALREGLRTKGIGWIDDPTNEDHAYERPRIRSALDEQGFSSAMRVAAKAAGKRRDLDARTAALIGQFASRPATGLIRLDRAFAGHRDRKAATHALRLLLATTGGLAVLPDMERTGSLLDALATGTLQRATLARALVDARRSGIFLLREARGLPQPMQAVSGLIWDGRYRFIFQDNDTGIVIAPAGNRRGLAGALPPDVPESLARAALAATPCVTPPGKNVAVTPVVAPFARFLPAFDLQSARVLAELVDAAPVPAPPLPAMLQRRQMG